MTHVECISCVMSYTFFVQFRNVSLWRKEGKGKWASDAEMGRQWVHEGRLMHQGLRQHLPFHLERCLSLFIFSLLFLFHTPRPLPSLYLSCFLYSSSMCSIRCPFSTGQRPVSLSAVNSLHVQRDFSLPPLLHSWFSIRPSSFSSSSSSLFLSLFLSSAFY